MYIINIVLFVLKIGGKLHGGIPDAKKKTERRKERRGKLRVRKKNENEIWIKKKEKNDRVKKS